MNYQKLQNYLEDKIVITIKIGAGNTHQVQNLNQHFLTDNNLTTTPQLKDVLTRFYDSVHKTISQTISQDDKYYQLPAVDQLTADYFATTKPNLGIKSQNQIETAIADEHYQLLDQIMVDYQTSLPQEEEEEADDQVANLQAKAKLIDNNLKPFLTEPPASNDPQETLKVIKRNLLSSSKGRAILADIKQWLVATKKLTSDQQQALADQLNAFQSLDQVQVKKKSEEDQDEETTEKPTKDGIKNKEELIYLGGFILILAIVVSLFRK